MCLKRTALGLEQEGRKIGSEALLSCAWVGPKLGIANRMERSLAQLPLSRDPLPTQFCRVQAYHVFCRVAGHGRDGPVVAMSSDVVR